MKARGNARTTGALMAGLLVALSMAASAWACTQSAYLEAANPQRGTAGTQTTLSGGSFNPGEVQIRWNSADGPPVGTASGPEFSARIRVPQGLEPGTYYLVAIQKGATGAIVGKGSAAFEVVDAPAPVLSGGGTGFLAPANGLRNRKAVSPDGSFESGRPQQSVPVDDLWRGFAVRPASLGTGVTLPAERSGSSMAIGIAFVAVGVLATGALVALSARGRIRIAAGRR